MSGNNRGRTKVVILLNNRVLKNDFYGSRKSSKIIFQVLTLLFYKVYRELVATGMEIMEESPWKKLVGQIIFGDADFVTDIQSRISEAKEIGEIPRAQRFAGRPSLIKLFPPKMLQNKTLRNEQIKIAHIRYGYTLKAIAEHLKIHYTTVSKIARIT